MKSLIRKILLAGVAAVLPGGPPLANPSFQDSARPQIEIDPQTGRAVGAKEMAPAALRKLIDEKAKMILIDVRDEGQFQKETIPGAIHIPFTDLEARLKEIPKDTILAFT